MKTRMDVAGPAWSPYSLHFRGASFNRFFSAWNERGFQFPVTQDAAINEEVPAWCCYPSSLAQFGLFWFCANRHQRGWPSTLPPRHSWVEMEDSYIQRFKLAHTMSGVEFLTTAFLMLATSISCGCQIGRRPRLVKKQIPNQRRKSVTTFLECSAFSACQRFTSIFIYTYCLFTWWPWSRIIRSSIHFPDVSELLRMTISFRFLAHIYSSDMPCGIWFRSHGNDATPLGHFVLSKPGPQRDWFCARRRLAIWRRRRGGEGGGGGGHVGKALFLKRQFCYKAFSCDSR